MRHTDKHRTYRRKLRRDASKAEKLLWFILRNNQTGYKIRRQHSIGPYIVDFFCPTAKLVIEVDGPTHLDPMQQAYDQKRTTYIESLGYKVIRYSTEQVHEDREAVATDIQRICNTRT